MHIIIVCWCMYTALLVSGEIDERVAGLNADNASLKEDMAQFEQIAEKVTAPYHADAYKSLVT